MATTYTLISSNTLSSSAASVTFSAIPSTYTDLCLRISARSSVSTAQNTMNIRFNGVSTSLYSVISLRGNGGGTVDSQVYGPNATEISFATSIPAATATANTFNNFELYIPSYTASQNKPVSAFIAQENNLSSPVYIQADASLFRSTAAITQIDIDANSYNFVSGSSFYLYGIKNS